MSQIPSTIVQPEHIEDPVPVLALLQEHEPLFWDEVMECWLMTRYEDVKAFFSDPRFSRDRRLGHRYVSPPEGSWAWRFANQSFGASTPEEHRAWRARVSAGFTPRAVRRMERQVSDVVHQFGDPLVGRSGVVDLVDTFTNPIPNTVISRITGIPPYPNEEDRFRRLAQDVIRPFFPMADEENVRRGEAAIGELSEWVGKLADERRQQPADDMLSDLIAGSLEEDGMSNDEIVMMVAALVAAGSETTTLGGTHTLKRLLEHPDQLNQLRAEPSLAENAVREALRLGFGGAGGGSPRFALEDMEVHGKTIAKGDMLMLSGTAANRDPSVWNRPSEFDITRDTRESLVFGNGPHYCLGANLALQEMRCMVESALEFLPEHATLLEPEWETIGLMHRPVGLPVDFG